MSTSNASNISDNESASDNEREYSKNKSSHQKHRCKACNVTFSRNSGLLRHMKNIHFDQSSSEEEEEEEEEEEDMSIDEDSSDNEQSSDEDMEDDDDDSEHEEQTKKHKKNPSYIFSDVVNKVFRAYEDELSPYIQEAMQRGMSERKARIHALLISKPAKKLLREVYATCMYTCIDERLNPLHQTILRKACEILKCKYDCNSKIGKAILEAVDYHKEAIYNMMRLSNPTTDDEECESQSD